MTMRLLYSHPQLVVVTQMRSLLEQAGIQSELRNEYAAGAIGELAPIDAWPELWVGTEDDAKRGAEVLKQFQQQLDLPDWHCEHCHSDNPASFDWCWHCGAAAAEQKPDN
ncbi:DUF2007 domain-containing protein [Parahaliea sp. F7430]|uniref:DUF2007 domain-containing protein n=1 Tax=Sediminihaliea albiluteola TaxID=2758564 RepID=A0A7W2YKR3_9GAMM|nr:DUF2007 domain-containing protein [Sediminihaliea albiluteola]MBA6414352.1 DUF2007 domain-containing protein [Sediminihaliea albiluteola]